MQPRARLFLARHGAWSNLDYILWINRGRRAYLRSKNLPEHAPIMDHDEFTGFLRRWTE